ncbi:MDR family MFS transporter [Glaciihabitans sp. dw_435]|uniref:MDR family MFS transporter n=1 Tax=Glaciihabitans sp. dw_435 TaxID=2720081 RepID=UPI001BD444AA
MSHRQVLESISGLLLGLFVAVLASTVVSTSLPRIIGDLKGDQTAYTWVVTSTLLATTVSTPIWGKLSDLFNRKLLVQISLVVFVLGSALAGLAQNTDTLIVFRVLQGLGAGGLISLVQVLFSDIISPRDRGRYVGILGAVIAVGTAGGPLLGGVITDSIGWRFNFYVAVPFAVAAIILIQRTLKLPLRPRKKVSIDYAGALLISAGVSLLLIWVSLAGNQFEWGSVTSYLMAIGGVVLLAAAVVVELKVKEPIIPMTLFKNGSFTLVVIGSLTVGVALFGSAVFLSQYWQLSRGATPTQAGLLSLPQVVGSLVASTFIGTLISRTGKWKGFMVLGASLLTVGLAGMSTIRFDTEIWHIGIFMGIMGLGLGMVMQNLVLVVQNSVDVRQIGTASSSVAFFRSLGGTLGVSVLGAVLASKVSTIVAGGIATSGATPSELKTLASGTIPQVNQLSSGVRKLVETAYGQGVGEIFLIATPLAIITLLCIIFLPNAELGTKTGIQQMAEKQSENLADLGIAEVGGAPVEALRTETTEEKQRGAAEDASVPAHRA